MDSFTRADKPRRTCEKLRKRDSTDAHLSANREDSMRPSDATETDPINTSRQH